MRMTARGSCGAGLTTTVLPMASAGPILPDMFTIGKLYDVMQLTTPTGARWPTAEINPPGANAVVGMLVNYEVLGSNGSNMLMVTTCGTAVRLD